MNSGIYKILNKSNISLLLQILLNYSGNNKEFTIEYQKIDKSIFILFTVTCLAT